MLLMLSVFANFIYYFKHGSKEIRENELFGAMAFGFLLIITAIAYVGCFLKGLWEPIALMLPFEFGYAAYYASFYFKNKGLN